ncbi:hypothetical protein AMECASPLE_011284 [Ameca splendens]|uniref:Uncharacterized protein n=1 Tax=Ameca splendens TaxID=208324 RepID=A0ABV0ZZJ2_9TELE
MCSLSFLGKQASAQELHCPGCLYMFSRMLQNHLKVRIQRESLQLEHVYYRAGSEMFFCLFILFESYRTNLRIRTPNRTLQQTRTGCEPFQHSSVSFSEACGILNPIFPSCEGNISRWDFLTRIKLNSVNWNRPEPNQSQQVDGSISDPNASVCWKF